ncbi:MAG: DUF4286 family protein [Acidobacteriota bacterium]|nr:DUF4286 family protein [Blastocatellia bacterium]MDW8240781.1 DUF4286 family protein [Acidobacteriota bacterium]
MVIYEITAIVSPALTQAFERYMREQHIPDVLATGYFTAACFASSTSGRYRVRYEATSQESLDRYLTECAPRLRADFVAHFPDGIQLEREVWQRLERWTGPSSVCG